MKKILCALSLITIIMFAAGCDNNDKALKLKVHEVGDFNVSVPDGWLEVPYYVSGTDEKMTDAISLYKDNDDIEDALYNSPGISIDHNNSCALYKENYTDTTSVEDVLIGDLEFSGFRSENDGYPFTQYIADMQEGCLSIILLQDRKKGTVNITDREIEEILKSIELTLDESEY